jgi:hypothetical protein
MTFYIRKDAPDCKDKWAVTTENETLIGCHRLKQDAIRQAVAASLSSNEPYDGDWANRKKRNEDNNR